MQTSLALSEFLHGSPAAALAQLHGVTSADGRWLRGAVLGALGNYGESLPLLLDLADEPPTGPHTSLACSTAASHYRQLGRHADAYTLDTRALAAAGSHPGALFDARLGLAADAVGAADSVIARAELGVARQTASAWRCAVRVGWVETEIALLTGDAGAAVAAARAGLATARHAAAPRHVAKCLLFLGVSEQVAGDPRARDTLAKAAHAARGLDALPLLWVAEAVLGAALPAAAAVPHLAAAASAIAAIADRLGPEDRARWVERPDIALLLTRPQR